MEALSSPASAVLEKVISSPLPKVLSRLSEPQTVAAIWKRPKSEMVSLENVRLPRRTFENGLVVWAHDFQRRNLERLLVGIEAADAGASLLADARRLLERWFESAPLPHAFISLSVIADPGCLRLHIDRVGRRLLTTYVGPGTEWLEPSAAAEWRRDKCCWSPHSLHRLATGHVIVMRGSADDESGGLVHRAPPWQPSAPSRLLLRICDGEYHLLREGKAALPLQ